MNIKRTAVIVVVGGALLAWLAGAATSNRSAVSAPIERVAPIELRGAELASEVKRLHERLRPDTAPSQPGRNLFTFRPVAVRPLPPPPVALPPAITDAPRVPLAQPSFKLVGVAEDPSADGVVRTAFVSGEGQLFIAREGDLVSPRYRVVKISSDVVELVDLGDGSARRLALK